MSNSKAILFIFIAVTAFLYWYSTLVPVAKDRFLTIVVPSSSNANSSSLLDLKDFRYVLSPRNFCLNPPNPKFVLIVTSYAGETTARSAQRRAYSSEELSSIGIARVFLLSTITGKSYVSQSALEDEQRRYGDILQGNFDESYRNLTYKHVMGLKWASVTCPGARYIVKMDDDIAANLYDIVNIVESREGQFDFLGYVFKKLKPKRVEANKWYVTRDEYSGNMYPTFVSGWLYVTTPSVAQRIVEKSRDLKYLWIDDVFVTGLVADALGLTHEDIGNVFTTYPESLDCCASNPVRCHYSVGPSGGDFDIIVRFQRHSSDCRTNCSSFNSGRTISKNCVSKKASPQLGRGVGSLKKIKI